HSDDPPAEQLRPGVHPASTAWPGGLPCPWNRDGGHRGMPTTVRPDPSTLGGGGKTRLPPRGPLASPFQVARDGSSYTGLGASARPCCRTTACARVRIEGDARTLGS